MGLREARERWARARRAHEMGRRADTFAALREAQRLAGEALASALDAQGAALLAAAGSETRRGEAPWVGVAPSEAGAGLWPGPDAPWRTAAARKRYGDTD